MEILCPSVVALLVLFRDLIAFLLTQIVYVCWLCFELVFVYFFVIETNNRTLEETSALFDGEEATKHISGHAANQAGVFHLDKNDFDGDKYDDLFPKKLSLDSDSLA